MSYHMNPDLDKDEAIMLLSPRGKSFKRTPGETVLTIFPSGHGFIKQSAAGTQTDDTSDPIFGSQSLKLTTQGDGAFVNSKKTGMNFSVSSSFIKFWIKVDDPSNIQDIRVQVSNDNFVSFFTFIYQTDFTNLEANVWEPITISPGNWQQTGSPPTAGLTAMIVRCTDKNTGKALNVNFGSVSTVPLPANGVAVISFDDGLDSLYTRAKAKMDQYGYQGVAYVIPTSLDASGRVTTDQVKQMLEQGWDISGHDHPNMTTLSLADCERQLKQVKYELLKIGCGTTCEHFAWPNGGKNKDTINILRKYYVTGRSVTEGLAETLPPANRWKIRPYNITENDVFATVQTRITQAKNNKELLFFCFHAIVDTVTDGGATQTSTSKFNQIIDELNTQGLEVKTLSQIIKDF